MPSTVPASDATRRQARRTKAWQHQCQRLGLNLRSGLAGNLPAPQCHALFRERAQEHCQGSTGYFVIRYNAAGRLWRLHLSRAMLCQEAARLKPVGETLLEGVQGIVDRVNTAHK
jgi:hypothetical protein